MGFKEDLEQICGKVEGSFAASLMGFDGIAIETVEVKRPDGIELTTLLIEYSSILSQVRQAAETLQMGKASEVSIRTEKLVAVARQTVIGKLLHMRPPRLAVRLILRSRRTCLCPHQKPINPAD